MQTALPQPAVAIGVIDYSLTLWKRAYLGHLKPAQLDGVQMGPEQMLEKIRCLQKENEYLKRQREILKKAMSILGGGTAQRYATRASDVGGRTQVPRCPARRKELRQIKINQKAKR